MTLTIGVPMVIDNTAMTLASIPETDYTAWSGATAYAVSDRAMVAGTTHKNYECIQAHTNKPPTTAANVGVGAFWLEVGATNRWRPFDGKVSYVASDTVQIVYTILLSTAIDAVAFFGLTGGGVFLAVDDLATPRRNLLIYTEQFGDASYTKTRVSGVSNTTKAPNFATTADTLREDATAAATHEVTCPSVTFTSGLLYTFSVSVKREVGSRNVEISLPASAFGTEKSVSVNLGTGAINATSGGATSSITAEVNGWYRISVAATATANAAGNVKLYMLDGSFSRTFNGDNTSGLYVFGAQVEQGALTFYQSVTSGGAGTWGLSVYQSSQTLLAELGYYKSEAVFQGIPGTAGRSIGIIISADVGNALVGEISLIKSYALGEVTQAEIGIVDYSRKDRDTFGNPTLIRRNFSQTVDYTFFFPLSQARQIQNFLAYLRAVPVVYYDTDNVQDWGTNVLGFYNDFSIPLTADGYCFATLAVESMA